MENGNEGRRSRSAGATVSLRGRGRSVWDELLSSSASSSPLSPCSESDSQEPFGRVHALSDDSSEIGDDAPSDEEPAQYLTMDDDAKDVDSALDAERVGRMYRPQQQADFQPLQRRERHAPRASGSSRAAESLSRIFRMIFTDTVLDRIVMATNSYAQGRDAGHTGRSWDTVFRADILHFFASLSLGTKSQYFGGALHETGFPGHPLLSKFTLLRWERMKRFIHIENPEADEQEDSQNRILYHKVGWLVDHIGEVIRQFRDPGSVLSYDKAMVRFSGSASEIVRAPKKPISQGYEVMTLCSPDRYVYAFYLRSTLHRGPAERLTLSSLELHYAFQLNEANKVMIYPPVLPSGVSRETVVEANNRFLNVPVMSYLRHMSIGGLGPFRVNAKGLPAEVKRAISEGKEAVKSSRARWAQTVSYVVTSTLENQAIEILLTLWIDQNVVSMMSTVHTRNRTDDFVFRVYKRPRGSSTNARSAGMPFGDHPTALLPIPKLINDCNKFMDGVGSFDQRRATFDMRLKSRQTWMPLFQFLLDVALVNANFLSREAGLGTKNAVQKSV